jgi:hypothetical protein
MPLAPDYMVGPSRYTVGPGASDNIVDELPDEENKGCGKGNCQHLRLFYESFASVLVVQRP